MESETIGSKRVSKKERRIGRRGDDRNTGRCRSLATSPCRRHGLKRHQGIDRLWRTFPFRKIDSHPGG